jgi:hypothetical protein
MKGRRTISPTNSRGSSDISTPSLQRPARKGRTHPASERRGSWDRGCLARERAPQYEMRMLKSGNLLRARSFFEAAAPSPEQGFGGSGSRLS